MTVTIEVPRGVVESIESVIAEDVRVAQDLSDMIKFHAAGVRERGYPENERLTITVSADQMMILGALFTMGGHAFAAALKAID